jgi:catechol 2,3-dioxygenase-like lactoylglutathione lyase family enzyme
MKQLFGIAALATLVPISAVQAETDPLVATSSVDPAAASPLRQVSLYVRDIRQTRRFLVSAMAMREDAAKMLAATDARQLGLPRGTVATSYSRPALAGAANIRVYSSPIAPPPLRPGHVADAPGGLAMGMPVADQAARERRVTATGFRSAVGATSMTLPRGDGTTYTVSEIHYRAPDGVLVLGIDRGSMRPVGPMDTKTGIGGPAYASIVVDDLAGSERFMRDVLRYEKRRDAVFTSAGSKGGLGLADGQRFAFQQWFAPGASTGYVIVMKMLDRASPAAGGGGFGHSGLTMLGFDAADLSAVEQRAVTTGARIVARPTARRPALLLAMPDGFLIEIAQRAKRP